MENKQLSSVEWLMQQIALKHGAFQAIAFYEDNFEAFQQAKAMHKTEVVDAYLKDRKRADFSYVIKLWNKGEQYYNETFGGNNESN